MKATIKLEQAGTFKLLKVDLADSLIDLADISDNEAWHLLLHELTHWSNNSIGNSCKFCNEPMKPGTGCINPSCLIQKSEIHRNVTPAVEMHFGMPGSNKAAIQECKHQPLPTEIYESTNGTMGTCQYCNQTVKWQHIYPNQHPWVLADEPTKGDYIRELAKKKGIPLVDIKLSAVEHEDMLGMPRCGLNESKIPTGFTQEVVDLIDEATAKGNPNRHVHADLIHAYAEGARIECKWMGSPTAQWQPSPTPAWLSDFEYRIAEPKKQCPHCGTYIHENSCTYRGCVTNQITKPEINWDHVHPDYNWLCRDSEEFDNQSWLSKEKPELCVNGVDCWATGDAGHRTDIKIGGFASFKPGTCNWKDSLICRPGVDGHE